MAISQTLLDFYSEDGEGFDIPSVTIASVTVASGDDLVLLLGVGQDDLQITAIPTDVTWNGLPYDDNPVNFSQQFGIGVYVWRNVTGATGNLVITCLADLPTKVALVVLSVNESDGSGSGANGSLNGVSSTPSVVTDQPIPKAHALSLAAVVAQTGFSADADLGSWADGFTLIKNMPALQNPGISISVAYRPESSGGFKTASKTGMSAVGWNTGIVVFSDVSQADVGATTSTTYTYDNVRSGANVGLGNIEERSRYHQIYRGRQSGLKD